MVAWVPERLWLTPQAHEVCSGNFRSLSLIEYSIRCTNTRLSMQVQPQGPPWSLASGVLYPTMHVLRSICFALTLAISTLAETPVNAKRDLIPTRRAPTLEGRELWNRNIIPKTSVRLDYGLGN